MKTESAVIPGQGEYALTGDFFLSASDWTKIVRKLYFFLIVNAARLRYDKGKT